MVVATNVDKAIRDAGLSRSAVARATNIARTSLYYRLTGTRPFDVDELEAIGKVVGRDYKTFLAEVAA